MSRVVAQAGHVPVLDGVRGVAIGLVLANHLTAFGGPHAIDQWWNYLAWWGWIGVDLFFVLSGYLITGILLDARDKPGFFKNFYARRALRIFPLYYAILIGSAFILPSLLPPDKAARFGSLGDEIVFYFLYLQNFTIANAGATRHGILDVTWSLAIEEQFYLVWPSVVFLVSRRALTRVCVGLFAFALVARLYLIHAGTFTAFGVYVLTPCRLDALAVGAFLAIQQRENPRFGAWARAGRSTFLLAGGAALAIVVIELLVGAVDGWAPGFGPVSLRAGFTLNAVAFGGLLVWVVLSRAESLLARLFSSRPLTFLGKYSYGLYLVHLPIRALIRDRVYGPSYVGPPRQFFTIAGSELPGQLLFYPLALAPILFVAWISYHAYEKHFLKLKRFF